MGTGPSKFLKLFLPSICIFYAYTWSVFPPVRPYHETFGGGDYYLDLYFATNPFGPLRQRDSERAVKFSGYLVRGETTERVSGVWTEKKTSRLYEFKTREGRFHAMLLTAHDNDCEPQLHFVVDGKIPTRGTLRAGFCLRQTTAQVGLEDRTLN